MRCKACDTILTDFEMTRKDSQGVYYDMCSDCLSVARKAVSDNTAVVDTVVDRDYNEFIEQQEDRETFYE